MPDVHRVLLTRAQVLEITGFSRSHLYALMLAGEFPRPLQLSTKCVRWVAAEVYDWAADQIAHCSRVRGAA